MLWLLLLVPLLLGCPNPGSGGAAAPTATIETWPPQSGAEFLAYANGKQFKRVDYGATVSFNNGVFSYVGAAGPYHNSIIFTSNTTSYASESLCSYKGNNLRVSRFGEHNQSLDFTLTETSYAEPHYINNCFKVNCNGCDPYEYAAIGFIAETDCFLFLDEKFCRF